MPISHICLGCGQDLARRRPTFDEALALWIVSCPECGASVVRRRHPLLERRRSLRKTGMAVVLLVKQIAILGGLMALVVSGALAVSHQIGRGGFGGFDEEDWILCALYYGLLSTAVGVWIVVGLRHWRWWHGLLAFAALAFVVLTVCAGIDTADSIGRALSSQGPSGGGAGRFTEVAERFDRGLEHLLRASVALLTFLPLTLLGVLPGRGVVALERVMARGLVRRRRRLEYV